MIQQGVFDIQNGRALVHFRDGKVVLVENTNVKHVRVTVGLI